MEITHQQLNRVDLLKIVGRLDAASADRLQEHFEQLFQQHRYRIVLDVSQLEFISSPGLRVLAEARKRAHNGQVGGIRGGDIRLANLSPRLKDVFDLVGFTSLFHIYEDTVEAVGSF